MAPPDLPTPEAVARLIATRRTIHRFDPDRAVRPDLLRQALEAALRAPNHKHTEPWRFVVFGPEARQHLIDLNTEVIRARQGDAAAESKRQRWAEVPVFVAAFCRRSPDDGLREREDEHAVAAALQNAALYLWSAGVGTKWTTGPITRDPRFFDLAGVDEARERLVGLVMVGYPADVPAPPARSPDVVTWLP
jgi:nitroreductase